MPKESKELVQSKSVLEFITVANEVCLFLEEIEKYDMEFLLTYMQKVLPLLYLKGTMLPDLIVSDEAANERFVTLEEWEKVYLNILNKTALKDNFYYFNSYSDVNDKKEKGSIAENLADIYQDLKDFLLLYQKNTLSAQENAVHSCKKLFEINWGLKAINTHKAIHWLLFGKLIGTKDFFMGFSPN
jgi:hypothetical protein